MVFDENGFEVTVYTHGTASTKNGEAAYVYVALNPHGRVVDAHAGVLGKLSPLEADLGAIEVALRRLRELGHEKVQVTTDSALAEQLINRRMGIRAKNISEALQRIRDEISGFDLVHFSKPMQNKGLMKKFQEMEASIGDID